MKPSRGTKIVVAALFAVASPLAAQGVASRGTGEVGGQNVTTAGPASDRAREIFYVSDTKGEGKTPGLKVKLYQVSGDCELVEVPATTPFASGDKVRFAVEANAKGYIYIVQRGSSGKTTLLFPRPEINGGNNLVKRGSEVVVPGKGWFTFDKTAGAEELQFVFSRKKLDIVNALIPPSASTGAQPASAVPAPAAPAAGSDDASVLAALQSRTASRDIISPPSAQAPAVIATAGAVYDPTFAVSTAPDKSFVILQVRLVHN